MRTASNNERLLKLAILSLVVITSFGAAGLVSCKSTDTPAPAAKDTRLHVLGGAGMRGPLEEILLSFEREHGIPVVGHYGGSGELMAQLAVGRRGDLFVPGASQYVQSALDRGWIAGGTVRELVKHVPVIAVASGNPKNIAGLEDLARPGTGVALGDPEGCAIGRLADQILARNNLTEAVKPNIKARTPTVNRLALYVALGHVDAAIIWEDMATEASSRTRLAVVPISAEQNIIKTVSVGVTKSSENEAAARKLSAYLGSEEGLRIWSKWGFKK